MSGHLPNHSAPLYNPVLFRYSRVAQLAQTRAAGGTQSELGSFVLGEYIFTNSRAIVWPSPVSTAGPPQPGDDDRNSYILCVFKSVSAVRSDIQYIGYEVQIVSTYGPWRCMRLKLKFTK